MPGLGGFVKYRDEGSGSPFMARIFMGLYDLRDHALLLFTPEDKKEIVGDQFDEHILALTLAAEAVRDAAREIVDLISEHVKEINDGTALDIIGEQINVNRTIDKPLGQSIDKLLHKSIVATKTCLQSLLKVPLGIDIGFLFQPERGFEQGVKQLDSSGDAELANYLRQVRRWHEPLQKMRSLAEHQGWIVPGVRYDRTQPGAITVMIPVLDGLPLDEFAIATANRVLTMVEELIVHAMQNLNNRWPFLAIIEIPIERRDPAIPRRFRVLPISKGSNQGWRLNYREQRHFL